MLFANGKREILLVLKVTKRKIEPVVFKFGESYPEVGRKFRKVYIYME